MKKLAIALVSPTEESVPPQKYGGTELVIYNLAEELVKKGHKVYLLASGNSKTSAELLPIFEKGIREYKEANNMRKREIMKLMAIGKMLKILQTIKVDVVHNHWGWRLLPFFDLITYPVVTTLHGPTDYEDQKIAYDPFKEANYVSISDNQRKGNPHLNYIKTVYNGIDMNQFEFSDKKGNYFAFLGRISSEKGPKEAILTAKKAGVHLKIAAKIDAVDTEFFEKEIKGLIDGKQIEFIGEIGPEEKSEFLKNAVGLIAPIQWEEPFGLYFIEAMACGTPVISFKRGSVPELVKDKETGFICEVNNMEQMSESVKNLWQMPEKEYAKIRYDSRRHVEKNFSREKMTNEYEKVYQEIVNKKALP